MYIKKGGSRMDTMGFDRIARELPAYRDRLLGVEDSVKAQAFDIRFCLGQPVSLCGRDGIFFLTEGGGATRALTGALPAVTAEELQALFLQVCGHSVFSHEEEIRQGYVSFGGFCRAGLCGTTVLENGKIKTLRDITTLVFRIPRERQGCGDRLFLETGGLTGGVLIAGEPSSGKTTLLRDIARSLSLGKFAPAKRVAVLDQRGEISGPWDLGPCTDVLKGCPKALGLDIALRMLSPEVVVCDELSPEDFAPLQKAAFSGVSLIASVHAAPGDLLRRPLCRRLLGTGAFSLAVTLAGRGHPGEIAAIESMQGLTSPCAEDSR